MGRASTGERSADCEKNHVGTQDWSVWSISSVWLNQINQRNQTDQMNKTGWHPVRVGGARTYRGQHRYGGNLGGTLGFPVKLGLHTIPTLDPLMNHIPSGR